MAIDGVLSYDLAPGKDATAAELGFGDAVGITYTAWELRAGAGQLGHAHGV